MISVNLGKIDDKWIGIGFSSEGIMVLLLLSLINVHMYKLHSLSLSLSLLKFGSSFVICRTNNSLAHWYAQDQVYRPILIALDNPQIGITKVGYKRNGTYLTCSFTRDNMMDNLENYKNINYRLYLLATFGDVRDGDGHLMKHKDFKRSTSTVDFTSLEVSYSEYHLDKNKVHSK